MRPVFITRAANRGRRTAQRALVLLALPLMLVLMAGLAYAQPRTPVPAGLPPSLSAVNEQPVQLYEVGELFRRWEHTERQHFGRELLPAVAEMSVRARIRGVSQLEVLPLLSVIEADVMHLVAGGRDCAAGADSYARLLQTGKPEFLTGNASVQRAVERLGQAYEGCAEARQTITRVAAGGLADVLIADEDGAKSAERQRAAVAALRKPGVPEPEPAASPGALTRVERAVTGVVVKLGGDPMVRLLAEFPALDPDGAKFARFWWWSLVVLMAVLGRVTLTATVAAVGRGQSAPAAKPTNAASSGIVTSVPKSARAPGRQARKSAVIRNR